MKIKNRMRTLITISLFCLTFGFTIAPSVTAQNTGQKPKPKMGFNPFQMDSRAKELTYYFKDTDEDLTYCLFVSSKVSKDKKAPLIVTLHGLGAGPSIMITKEAADLAEKGGYILVAPMGYNVRGWYGIPMTPFPGMSKNPPRNSGAEKNAAPKPKPKASLFYNPNDPPNLRELSEKDVMNVLDIVRREYNVDENRIYLMGHSMGGAGTLNLGIKYGSIWAALAPVAPAAFGMKPESLAEIKKMPIIFIHGDIDEAVPVSVSRQWVEKAKELNMTYEYNEMKGITHGPVITAALQSVYEFFGKHSKSAGKEVRTWKDIDYVGDGIVGHKLDIYLPSKGSGPFPAIVYIYGSAWFANNMKGTAGMFSPALLDAGFAVVAINHRASKEAIFPAQINDAKAAIRFIRAKAASYNLDPSWVGVTGGSSGGHLTALLGTSGGVKEHTSGSITYDIEGSLGAHTGTDSSVQAACDWFGPTNFLTMDSCGSQLKHDPADSPESTVIGGAIQDNPDKCALANPVTYVDADDPPFMIFHGNKDPLVPFCQSDALHKRLTEAGVDSTYIQVSNAGHGTGLTTPINVSMMARFFTEALEQWNKNKQ